ncbi:hypothetical protein [uncultured Treponema sp.]|uniref:hypothetical protein n=1 Tax=uncultured Treponema sp. TaxID=162155 RepID=UPI0027D9CB72|nr:hypothetical protein [uncultured Treponema sp.]
MKYFMERKNTALLFAMLLFAPCFAAAFPSVGFQIIQHDPSGDEIRNCVYIIEDALFDTFFSNGIIISNSPPVSSDPKEFDSVFRKSLDEARESGTDLFVELTGEFDVSDSTNPSGALLDNISSFSYTVIDIDKDEVLFDGKKIPQGTSKITDSTQSVRDFGFEIAADIFNGIRKNFRTSRR